MLVYFYILDYVFFIFNEMTTYISDPSWDTNINSKGGIKDVHLVTSPWSHNPSANSTQGFLTSGVLINEFEPPMIDYTPATSGYFYQNRLDMGVVNKRAAIVNRQNTTSADVGQSDALPNATVASAAVAPQTLQPINGNAINLNTVNAIPNKVISSATTATTTSNTANGPYVAPSRRNGKNTLNASRTTGKEQYNSGIPGLIGSNIHTETFTNDCGSNRVIIILLLLVALFIAMRLFTEMDGSDSFRGYSRGLGI